MTLIEDGERIVRDIARRVAALEEHATHQGEVAAFDASRVLIGLGLGLQAGGGVTITKSGSLLVVGASGAPAAHNILSSSHDATTATAASGDLVQRNSGNTAWARLPLGTAGQKVTPAAGIVAWVDDYHQFELVIGDGTNVISTGVYGPFLCEFTGTVDKWTLLCGLPIAGGALQLDLWKTTYANYDAGSTHPVVGDTVTGSDKPRITATGTKGNSSALTGWTTGITAGDIYFVKVDSVASIKLALLSLRVKKAA